MYVVATLGSLGDLHPFLAIARALHERGDDVLFLSQEAHRAEVETQGLHFRAIASLHDHHRTLKHPDLWHPIRGFGVLWRHLVVPALDPTVAILQGLMRAHPGQVKVVSSPLVIGARLLYDLNPYALTTAHTAPSGLRSTQDPMFIGSWQVPSWWPRAVRQRLWRAVDHFKLHPMALPFLNHWRTQHGLPELATSVFGQWMHSPHQTLALFPDDFGPCPSDWPVPVTHVGFPLYLASNNPSRDATLARFIAYDPTTALLVFYPGSAGTSSHRHHFTRLARAAAHLNARCLLIGPKDVGPTGPVSAASDRRLLWRDHVDMPNTLAHAWLFVHHGGVGAIAHALTAGTTQAVAPSAYDQFDNAWRLVNGEGRHFRLDEMSTAKSLLSRAVAPSQKKDQAQYPSPYSTPANPNASVRSVLTILSE